MDTNKHEWIRKSANTDKDGANSLLAKQEVFQIVGCAIEVLNTLGHGIVEKPYENALVVEFGLGNIPFLQQPPFEIAYKDHKIGLFIPDLIVFDSIVVDTKVIERRPTGPWLQHRVNVELPPDHKTARRRHPELQTS
jgi:GxxExxY protein